MEINKKKQKNKKPNTNEFISELFYSFMYWKPKSNVSSGVHYFQQGPSNLKCGSLHVKHDGDFLLLLILHSLAQSLNELYTGHW